MQSKLFPPAYEYWLSNRLAGSLMEIESTCDSCAMVKPVGITRDPGPFKEHLKCCTYFPFVPSFGIGGMLVVNQSAVELRLSAAETQGLLLPVGLHISPERQDLIESFGIQGFGQQDKLLCPFFDTKKLGCSVWENRPGVCTTYFCKSNRGKDGLKFWGDVEKYLNHFEWTMAVHVFHKLGFTDDDMEMCKAAMSIEEAGEERNYFLDLAWSNWKNKKTEYFKAALTEAKKVSQLEIDLLLGKDFLILENKLRASI